jgi:LPXTG-motif cell wall-anchored protein
MARELLLERRTPFGFSLDGKTQMTERITNMKLQSLIQPRTAWMALCGLGLALGVVGPGAHADGWDKRTILTVGEPIQIREQVLQPGTYVVKLLNSDSDRHVVQIFKGDERHFVATVLAVPAYRMDPTAETQLTFWETPQGSAKALRNWYYPGDNSGEEFPYPAHLTTVAMVNQTDTTPAPVVEPPPPAPVPPVVEPPQPEPQPQPEPITPPVTEPDKTSMDVPDDSEPAQTPVVTPIPTTDQPSTSSSADRSDAELPHTGSDYPVIGFGGLVCLSLFGLLRAKRQSLKN